MRRSANRRRATEPRSRRVRLIAAGGALVVFGAIIGVTQISSADENRREAQTRETVNGLEILANDCEGSQLEPHDGFQLGDRCVSTAFGEVGAAENNPTLLITEAPDEVEAGQPFTLRISTRNLIRDRFLAAGQGGYYVESSVLQDGLVRGHFHTACRSLGSTDEAPDPAPVPAFFVATEDSQGGRTPDTVTIQVPGIPDAGPAQCSSWAGDGSHRIPMMQRANQTPAIDSVRIDVRGGGEQPPAEEEPPAEEPPAEEPPAEEPPAEEPPAEQPPAEQPGDNDGGNDNGGNDNGGNDNGGNDNGGDNNGGGDQNPPPAGQPQTNTGTVNGGKTTAPSTPKTEATTGAKESEPKAKEEDAAVEVDPGETESLSGRTEKKKESEPEAEPTEEVLIGDDGAPDDAPGDSLEPAAAQSPESDKLALTGNNTIAMVGGGVVLALIGFVILSALRKRRPRATHYYQ